MAIHFELVILVLALTLAGQVHTGEIFGGHIAVPHSRPYMVLLEMPIDENRKKNCDGFLLNEEFVMTAAHCQAKNYTALLGVHNVHDKNEILRVPVEKAFPHKEYKTLPFLKNDIMLLMLNSKVNFTENVTKIDLADEDDGFQPKSCLVSGWGLPNRSSNFMSSVLMEVNVTLIDNEDCAKENFYCTEGKNGPGQGDSGGPLVCEDGKAYGVVSFSSKQDSDMMYVFTKIRNHRRWIDETMKYHGKKQVTTF